MKLGRRNAVALLAGSAVAGAGALGYRTWRRTKRRIHFDDSVPDDVRRLVRRVDDRLPQVVLESFSEPIRVRLVPAETPPETTMGPETRLETAIRNATHTSGLTVPGLFAEPGGSFNRRSRTLSLRDPDTIRIPSDLPADLQIDRDQLLNEPLVAHEMVHAIQGERVDDVTPVDDSTAASQALRGVTEGVADYVRGRYQVSCTDGTFDPCVSRDPIPTDVIPPAALVLGHQPYVTGRLFAHHVIEDGGWEAIWAVHESPPAMPVDVMFPDRFLDGPTDPVALDPTRPASSEWIELGSERRGAFDLYTKLFALGVVSPTDVDAAADPTAVERTGYEWAYRTDLLRGFRGDLFVGFGHVDDLDHVGSHWQTAWRDETAAREIIDAVTRGYDERGDVAGDGWLVDGTYHGCSRSGRVVTFLTAPTRSVGTSDLASS